MGVLMAPGGGGGQEWPRAKRCVRGHTGAGLPRSNHSGGIESKDHTITAPAHNCAKKSPAGAGHTFMVYWNFKTVYSFLSLYVTVFVISPILFIYTVNHFC